ncbi:NACHT N-terminal helical domain 7-containing protein [Lentzea aerocolonigenes]|uniref:NACHT N-terminal helical domain 7-containing protein n=1 Tax=Lentzea aerocolonigenes TaxID=68170 RepID=UPI000A5EC0FF|nr:TIR domain-containing protein [Lentzea aerocolonigenes]MCP2248649.1 WD domain-containing protein, G-beta repeat-containing protein [Lentzea aerocolonigenes]
MPPVDATTLRGALLTLAQDDEAWLEAVDRLLGRVLSGTSIQTSMYGLYGWIDGGEAPKLIRDRLAQVVAQLPTMTRRERLDPIVAVHTVLVASVFFETVSRVLTHELQLDKRNWQQEDHSFISYLYSDEMPTPSITRPYTRNLSAISRWVTHRGARVHHILQRTSPHSGSEVLLEPAFVRYVLLRFEVDFRMLAADVGEFATWAGMKRESSTVSGAATDAHTILHRTNQAVLHDPLPNGPGLPPLADLYVTPDHRLAVASPLTRLIDESWWSSETRLRHDLDQMLAAHLASPDAYRLPLLVVGGPGSGKSALAKVLAAREFDTDHVVVRVPMRMTRSDTPVDLNINEELQHQTDGQIRWSDLRDEPCVVVLDGLDEMSRTSTSRYYLDDVLRFQRTRHQVAVVATCRTSYLDHLLIPDDTPVALLADFDEAQIGRWVEQWNRATAGTGRRPMTLEAALAHPELARNPFQLTMLTRQLTDPAARDFAPGVAALGMLNRGWRPISPEELRADLTALGHTDLSAVESVLRDLDQQPATFAEYLIADVLARTLREHDDELLFTLLSHAPLSLRPATLTFVRQLLEEAPAELERTLDDLLAGHRTRTTTGRYPDYRPTPPDQIRSAAAYTANLVLLRLFTQPVGESTRIAGDQAGALIELWSTGLDAMAHRSLQALISSDDIGFARRPSRATSEAKLDPDGLPAGVEFVHRGLTAGDRPVTQVTWSSDGRLLTTSYGGDSVVCWRVAENVPPHVIGELAGIADVDWHPTRPVAAVVQRPRNGGSRHVMITRFEDGTTRELCEVGRRSRIAWSPDGGSLAVFSTRALSTVDVTTGERRTVTSFDDLDHQSYLLRPRWSRDGDDIWVAAGGTVVTAPANGGPAPVTSYGMHARDVFVRDGRQSLVAFTSPASSDIAIIPVHTGGGATMLEGHTKFVSCVRFSPNGDFLGSLSEDNTVRIWRCEDWQCVAVLARREISGRGGLAFHPTEPLLAIKDGNTVDIVRFDPRVLGTIGAARTSRKYANAKIVLVGDTGVGKSGLGLVMSGQPFAPTDSTHGRNVWTFEKSIETTPSGDVQTRETLLWDLAGQPGYRMVHQLHLNEVAVALVVFDARSETDPFAGVQYWSRALAQARRLDGATAGRLRAYLVAARTDRGGTAVGTARIEQAVRQYGFDGFVETSAKEGWGVDELVRRAREAIDWDAMPVVSSTALFQSIKDFVLEEKRQGRILSTVDDLLHSFRRVQQDETPAEDLIDKFTACLGRLESIGVIRRMAFGDYVLLRPELLDAYVSSLVQAAKDEPDGLGFVPESDALAGTFRMPESERLDNRQQERILLITVVEELLRREIALKEVTDKEVDLIFPSQFTRERPDAPKVPGQDVVFTFDGDLASIYSTLAVRLSHSRFFKKDEMWHNSATYRPDTGGTCGIAIREIAEGRGELVVFHDEQVQPIVRRQFEAYVAEHLEQRAGSVVVRRVRRCKVCDYAIDDEVVRRRLGRGLTTVACQICDAIIPITDDEQPDVRPAVAEMNSNANAQRDQDVAATTLKGKREAGDYDVFLCHNVKDKPAVLKIVHELHERGILPWLDIHDIPPGSRWQQEMADGIAKSRSAAVLIGPAGPGPWHEAEMELINDWSARNRSRRVIPVILEGTENEPELPGFLRVWSTVDMRTADPDPIEQLVWGITGQHPRWA